MNENSTEAPVPYSKFAKTMHWGFVLLFAYGVFKQVDNLSELADPSLFRLEIVFAGVFILLLIIRFIYVKKTQRSALPEDTSKMQKIAAKLVHLGMYVSLGSIAFTRTLNRWTLLVGYERGFHNGCGDKHSRICCVSNVLVSSYSHFGSDFSSFKK